MADESNGGRLPPPSEEVHLPAPSYLPALTALGITLAITGVVLSWIICGIGVVIAVVAIFRWVRQTREEMAELPLEH
jgi:uncharacterized membrane protein (DUF485 family)